MLSFFPIAFLFISLLWISPHAESPVSLSLFFRFFKKKNSLNNLLQQGRVEVRLF